MASALVLFDIDGTLIRKAGPQHRRALETAAREVMQLEVSSDGIPTQGMLDHDILRDMLLAAGVKKTAIRAAMSRMVHAAETCYMRECLPHLRHKVCPGARNLLLKLHRKDVPTGLVTGNFTRIGWKKMELAGLQRYLRFGAFAELAKDRAGLVKIAMKEARAQGWLDRKTVVTLIGDHPNDILAARANGIRSVAVATGVVDAAELQTHKPDILVADLRTLHPETLLQA
ncbi:hydrolase [Bryobacterales bacterium F-183]|nr:hydrolase [Bryobacterales bacterium F-183]